MGNGRFQSNSRLQILVVVGLALISVESIAATRMQVSSDKKILSVDGVMLNASGTSVESPKLITLGAKETKIVFWTESLQGNPQEYFSKRNANGTWSTPQSTGSTIQLKTQSFDPQANVPDSFALTSSHQDNERKLAIVQFKTPVIAEYRDALNKLGIEIHQYLPHRAFVVRAESATLSTVSELPYVQWVGDFSVQAKSNDSLIAAFDDSGKSLPSKFNIVMVAKSDAAQLMSSIKGLGGSILRKNSGSVLIEASLTPSQLQATLSLPEVLWVDPWSPVGFDVDNARTVGGANYLVALKHGIEGYTGVGINGSVLEGINPAIKDFEANDHRKAPIAVGTDTAEAHGHNTYGIVFGSGAENEQARGLLPNAQGHFTSYQHVYKAEPGNKEEGSRFELVNKLIKDYQVMFQTASWGYTQTKLYDARSLEMDDIIFTLDIPITQSQSNMGTRNSRPQAWAKNIISVGALRHGDNTDPSDDEWDGGASIGPAEDGRIKPDVSAFYDAILTTDLFAKYTKNFGGTSGATPIVAGHVGLVIELWTDGVFGNTLAFPVKERFNNRPHFSTTKALLINNAHQYPFEGAEHDRTRVHQGWGFPNVWSLHENRNRMLIVNEQDILAAGETKNYEIKIAANTPELKTTLVFSDPPGLVSSKLARVNNLDLKLTSPSGEVYLGNFGLKEGLYSKTGGQADTIDTVENVFISTPEAGNWKVEVTASEVNADGHVETQEIDADYALVVTGITK